MIEDPDLIYTGERLELPAVGAAGRATPAPDGDRRGRGRRRPCDPPAAQPAEAVAPQRRRTPLRPGRRRAAAPAATARPRRPHDHDAGAGRAAARRPIERHPSRGSPSPIGLGEAALLSAGVLALVGARRRVAAAHVAAARPGTRAAARGRRRRTQAARRRRRRAPAARRHRRPGRGRVAGRGAVAHHRSSSVGADGAVELVLSSRRRAAGTVGGRRDGLDAARRDADRAARRAGPQRRRAVRRARPARRHRRRTRGARRSRGARAAGDRRPTGGRRRRRQRRRRDARLVDLRRGRLARSASAVDADVFLDHRHAHVVASVDSALELAAVARRHDSRRAARQSTFVLAGPPHERRGVGAGRRARRVGAAGEVSAAVARCGGRRAGALAMVVGAAVADAPWVLRCGRVAGRSSRWGLELVPVGLAAPDVAELHAVLAAADAPLVDSTSRPSRRRRRAAPMDWTRADRRRGR